MANKTLFQTLAGMLPQADTMNEAGGKAFAFTPTPPAPPREPLTLRTVWLARRNVWLIPVRLSGAMGARLRKKIWRHAEAGRPRRR